jgi:hypothetical protein
MTYIDFHLRAINMLDSADNEAIITLYLIDIV